MVKTLRAGNGAETPVPLGFLDWRPPVAEPVLSDAPHRASTVSATDRLANRETDLIPYGHETL